MNAASKTLIFVIRAVFKGQTKDYSGFQGCFFLVDDVIFSYAINQIITPLKTLVILIRAIFKDHTRDYSGFQGCFFLSMIHIQTFTRTMKTPLKILTLVRAISKAAQNHSGFHGCFFLVLMQNLLNH